MFMTLRLFWLAVQSESRKNSNEFVGSSAGWRCECALHFFWLFCCVMVYRHWCLVRAYRREEIARTAARMARERHSEAGWTYGASAT